MLKEPSTTHHNGPHSYGRLPFFLAQARTHLSFAQFFHRPRSTPTSRTSGTLSRVLQTPRSSVGNMRASRQRPTSLQGVTPHTAIPAAAIRKIFNCIVDDSALVAGVKRSTRNGIRQWVKNTQIRLFVPLHGA